MATPGIDSVLREMQALAAQASGAPASAENASPVDFGTLLQQSIEQVNAVQQEAQQIHQAFEAGEPGADLQDVMVSLQKASLSFQTMLQVRNKLVTAYQEVMNMQV